MFDNIKRRSLIQDVMTDLYELQRGSMKFYNCTVYSIYAPNRQRWATIPCKFKDGTGRGIPASTAYKQMLDHLGRTARFAVAVSPREFDDTGWFALEFDGADGFPPPDESTLERVVNHDLATIVERHVKIHWMLSGGRSPHLHVFTNRRLRREIWLRFEKTARHLIKSDEFRCDKGNLTQCMRIPLSYHAKTAELARYSGCPDEETLAAYLRRSSNVA